MDFKDLYEGPRFEKRAKRRKVNKLLNIGIVLVVIGIVFFSYKLFFGGTEQASTEVSSEKTITSAKDLPAADEKEKEEEPLEEETNTEDDTKETTEEESEVEEVEPATKETEKTIENSEDPNVKETIVNEAWKPVGTTQAEPHVATYDSKSTDWQEMMKALEYATGLTQQDWILWRIGNGGSPNHAQGVVSTKDKKYVYRVQMEWVKGEGWKPSKLETLNQVPAEYTGTSMNSTNEAETSTEE
ncbi:DUF1510 family protein [Bacillus suaedaesalsae]|uniref:YrrS family protein n=1 Tax=Bacillus suaedaesalsae TaxID=2810349 RepID=A0ABS2DMU7_9BACI|nr:YrrS family protein [Bacillus suaedaesalsae]